MRPRISKQTEKKLDIFADKILEGTNADKLPASQKVRLLVKEHDKFTKDFESWVSKGSELANDSRHAANRYVVGYPDSENYTYSSLPSDSEYRRMHIDDETVEDLKKVLETERPTQAALDNSFDRTLGLVLEAYNLWAREVGLGWRQY